MSDIEKRRLKQDAIAAALTRIICRQRFCEFQPYGG